MFEQLIQLSAAVSSYISVTDKAIYSAGGHTAELHEVANDGGFGAKLQELKYLPHEEMKTADKTRKALVHILQRILARQTMLIIQNLGSTSARW